LLVRAAEEAYHGLLMEGRHPLVALNVSLPPEEIDVNVHPAKTEVRFSREQAVFSSVTEAVKGTLHRTPVATTKAVSFSASSYREQSTWTVTETEAAFAAPLPAPGLPALRVMGQLASTYIIGEGPEGLYLVDQHAAHERVLYEEIQAQWSRHKIEVQGLLQATTVEFSPREEQIWEANKEKLAQFGFAVEPFGGRSYLLRSVPATVAGTNIVEALRTLLEAIAGMETTPLEEKIMQSLACHAAIRAGQRLSNVEMAELIQQLERAKQPRTCPHGRPTMIHLSSRQLEKEFGRTG
jgi:DNA mismatch repair protein MutL